MSKKASTLYVVLFLMVLTVQVSMASQATAGRTPVTLQLANYWTDTRVPLMEAQLEKFHELYPWITVENRVTPAGDIPKWLVAIAGGAGPDVWMVGRTRIPEFAELGILQPLDDFIKQDGFNPSIFYKSEFLTCQYRGQTYSLPMPTVSLSLLYYNRALLAQSGYNPDAPPETWKQMLDMATRVQRIDADGVVQIGGGFIGNFPAYRLAQIAYTNGAQIFRDELDVNYLGSPVREAANWLVEFSNRVPRGGDFVRETLVFLTHGEYHYFRVKAANPSIDMGMSILPHGPSGETLNVAGAAWSYGIPVGARHPYESWLLVKFLTSSEEGARAFAFEQQRPSPVIRFCQDRRYFEANPYWNIIGDMLNRTFIPTPSLLTDQIIKLDVKYFNQLAGQQQAPENVLVQLQAEIDTLVAEHLATRK